MSAGILVLPVEVWPIDPDCSIVAGPFLAQFVGCFPCSLGIEVNDYSKSADVRSEYFCELGVQK